ncbi:ATP-binding protein [Spirosoma luteum]|uniref:ATP-binding protein n=1 Tax=Spirosoma luteum TaxID=431553 RepID=UPI000379CB48|nr:ATP-binding protein [Spirosoma luteum]
MQEIAPLIPCGVLVLNAESCIVSINPFACSLLEYEAAELVGQRIDRLLTIPSRIYFQTHIYPLITLRKVASELYLNVQTRQRVQIPVLLNAVSQEQDGTSVTYISFIPVYQRRQFEQELINAKKAAEEALLRNDELVKLKQELELHQTDLDRQLSYMQHRNDELEQFSKIISHDLQEPLRKITLFADLLSHEKPDALTSMGNRALVGIETATVRMRQLISDLQFYFTLAGQLPDLVDTIDLAKLVQELIREFGMAQATFEVEALPAVLGNKAELINLFRHLLDNAVKFREPGQSVAIRVTGTVIGMNSFQHLPNKYRYSDYARIIVSDNGPGFSNQHSEEIFHILKKLSPNTPGIGLGLAISKKIVERHNGQISAQSSPGKGTQITVLLPVV